MQISQCNATLQDNIHGDCNGRFIGGNYFVEMRTHQEWNSYVMLARWEYELRTCIGGQYFSELTIRSVEKVVKAI